MLTAFLKSEFTLSCSAAAIVLFSSCSKDLSHSNRQNDIDLNASKNATVSMKGTEFYALTTSNELVHYYSGNPLVEKETISITGLQSGEKVLAIDFRPATGQLYGVTSQSRIYFINVMTGMAYTPSMTPFTPAINGTMVGFDFNPTVDRIRLVTNTGQDLRLNPETGMVVAIDGNISIPSAKITAVAYTNSYAGTTTTTLYDIDVAANKLYIQSPPNDGVLIEVGSLGIEAVGEAGFDISPDNSVALAAIYGRGDDGDGAEMSNGNQYRFYYIDLMTGKAKNAGKTDKMIMGLAIPTNPVAYAVDNMNKLMIMNPETGGIITKTITGIVSGDMISGLDMRPATGQLYALGSMSNIYAINMSSGAVTLTANLTQMLAGTSWGFDFNPTVDRIRIVSNTGQNLRVHPVTGSAIVDGSLTFANPPMAGTPSVDAAGYTNSFGMPTTTMLFDVDEVKDMLFQQVPANNGTLTAIGPLGVDVTAGNGFDIAGTTNKAWGIFTVGNKTGLYSVNTSTGKATYQMAVSSMVRGFTIGLGF